MSILKRICYLLLTIHIANAYAEIKIFQIGFSKCATSSIAEFFNRNGIPAIHHDFGNLALSIDENAQAGLPLLAKEYSGYVVFTDMENMFNDPPINAAMLHFKELDKQYPGSKFILNTRDKNAWLKSRAAHRINRANLLEETAQLLKISKRAVLAKWSQEWDAHHRAVLDYFKNRPQDLLIFNIDTDDAEKLCDFFKNDFKLRPKHYLHKNATKPLTADDTETVEPLELFSKNYAEDPNNNLSAYAKNDQLNQITVINPELEKLLRMAVAYNKKHKRLPDPGALNFKALDLTYLYRIKTWASPIYAEQPVRQTGYIQGYFNGLLIGSDPGIGGMFTCILADKEIEIAAKCFYQIKPI